MKMDVADRYPLSQLLPEPVLLVTSGGVIVGGNPGVGELAGIDASRLPGMSLSSLVSDAPEKLESYLRMCSRSRQFLPGTLSWKSPRENGQAHPPGQGGEGQAGRKEGTFCEGAVVRPREGKEPAVVALRCRPRPRVIEQFAILSRKVEALTREVLERQRAEERLRRAVSIQSIQARVLEMLATDSSLEEVLGALVRMLERQTPGMLGSILLLDEDGKRLRHGAGPNLPEGFRAAVDGLEIGPSAGSCGTAAFTGRRVIVEDTLADPLWASYRELAREHGIRACWSQPIVSRHGRIVGTAAVYFAEPRKPSESEVAMLDITSRLAALAIERKQVELEFQGARQAAEAANHAKDKFLAVLSHELRTPLSPALATLYAMEQMDVPGPLHEDISMVRRNLELEARLIDDLLDVTRIARGKLEVTLRPIDVHAKLRNVIRMCECDATSKGVSVRTMLQAADHRVMGDSARIQQVLWNLLRNAVKFTPAGGAITLKSRNDQGKLFIEVSDTGIGIAPEMLSRIFEPFEQGERLITKAFGGLGLGLSIARNIIDLHGGRLSASSEGRGKGATFTVELSTCAAELPAEDHDPPESAPPPLPPLRILLVEDHEDTARVMTRLLRRQGHDVQAADSMGSALRAFETDFFDLVISDLGLPDGNGLDLIRQLRARGHIRAIALSGFGMEEDIRKSREAGFDEHLTKPVHPNELRAAIARVSGAPAAACGARAT